MILPERDALRDALMFYASASNYTIEHVAHDGYECCGGGFDHSPIIGDGGAIARAALLLPLCAACVRQTTSGGSEPGAMAGLRPALPREACSAPDCLSPLPPATKGGAR